MNWGKNYASFNRRLITALVVRSGICLRGLRNVMQNVRTGCIRAPEPRLGVSFARDRVMTLSHSSVWSTQTVHRDTVHDPHCG